MDCVNFLREAERKHQVVCETSRVVHEMASPLEVKSAFPLLAVLSPTTSIVVEMTACPDFVVGKVQQNGEHVQLFLILRATPLDGEPVDFKVLVDTGSQTNLIRTCLVESKFLCVSMRPLTLMTVGGDRLSGGDKEVTLRLFFWASAKFDQKVSD